VHAVVFERMDGLAHAAFIRTVGNGADKGRGNESACQAQAM
jgi:hypothetical protein